MYYLKTFSSHLTCYFFCVAFLLCIISPVYALTDQELIKTATELHQSGNSEKEIANILLQRGATIEQLQRIEQKYLSLQGSNNTEKTTQHTTITQLGNRTNKNIDSLTIDSLTLMPPVGKRIFGHEIFAQKSTVFAPQMNMPTPQDYVLGAGDQLIINFYGASQETFDLTISPDGIITIPEYGPVHVGGMNIATATRKLKSSIGSRYVNSQLMLSLGQSRSISVNVMGEVQFPGNYQLSAFANVLYAIYMAGGITETGTVRMIKVYRNSQLIGTIDLYDYLVNGASKNNIRLEDGDVILVGTYSELVRVDGCIKRPIFYELTPEETVHNLIYFAGGFTGDAYTDAIRIHRRSTIDGYSLHTVTNAHFADFRLMDGDSVYIEAILDRPQNTLEIQGAVFRPGFYGLSGNLHTAKQLVEMAQGFMENSLPKHAVLYRMKADRNYEAIQVNLQAIMDGTAPDMELNNEDRLFVPTKEKQLNHFTVTIHGEVYEPGIFPYSEHETVENLILRAGGMTDKASTSKINVVRHIIDQTATTEVDKHTMLFSISLDEQAQDFFLEPYDEVYVRTTPAYAPAQNIIIRGEVAFEGPYALKTKQDRLSELITAAGGLTQYAYPQGARLIRQMDEDEKTRRQQLLKINSAASSKDSVNLQKLEISDTYYVALDLVSAIANPGGAEDFILRDGDILIIPTMTTTVKINGEVLYPNTVNYTSGKKAKYYIGQAGGYSQLARKNKAYVIYANGAVAKASNAVIAPGCEIVVPSKPERQQATPTQWVSIASATASLASVAATIATLILNTKK